MHLYFIVIRPKLSRTFTDVAFQDDGGIVTTIYDQSTFTDKS
jgi:hypothetical protein